MKINNWYKRNFESGLVGRYITMQHMYPLLDLYKSSNEITVAGVSENGQDIPLIKIGSGKKVVLAWSQMHGNESTTTKALFDFIKFISQKQYFQLEIELFLSKYTFYIIPILNPDGAQLYTRENGNKVDLNRDAQDLSQSESKCLRKVFDTVKPELCLNMHDQRSIFGFNNGKPAAVSFLSPAANKSRSLTDARKVAMEKIVKMNTFLQKHIPEQVGRYDDSYNEACVGDTFQKAGVPTILFEAGHFKQDYQRENTRELIFYALLSLFDIMEDQPITTNYKDYYEIPENIKNYNDFILRNVRIKSENDPVDLAIQYQEVLKNDIIVFNPVIDEIGDLKNRIGHMEKDACGAIILTKSQDNLTIGSKISKIFAKSDNSVIFFQEFPSVVC